VVGGKGTVGDGNGAISRFTGLGMEARERGGLEAELI